MSESLEALRRANPRAEAGFQDAVDTAAGVVRARIATAAAAERRSRPAMPRRFLRVSVAGAALAVVVAAAVSLSVGSPGRGPAVEDAVAALKKAGSVSAASADRSGTAVVRVVHNGRLWAGKTVTWNGADLSVVDDRGPIRRLWEQTRRAHGVPPPGRGELRVVGEKLYSVEPGRGWVVLGDPESIDPGSGTTPAEYLAAVREDVGGTTVRRITDGIAGLTTRLRADGSTIYAGTVRAGLIARESGFKEGRPIRVLPFGYVAHDEAADPASRLDLAFTVAADGILREIDVTWGTGASRWSYTVTYSGLGATPAPAAPANAQPLRRLLHAGE